MRFDFDPQGGNLAGGERLDRRRMPAVDQACRQMPQQVDDQRSRQPLEGAPELGPDAGQRRHRRE